LRHDASQSARIGAYSWFRPLRGYLSDSDLRSPGGEVLAQIIDNAGDVGITQDREGGMILEYFERLAGSTAAGPRSRT